jgi:exosortase H (IPTLxxWG-CTERM-specific)
MHAQPPSIKVNNRPGRDRVKIARVREGDSVAHPGRADASTGRRSARFGVVFLLLILLFSSVASSRLVGVVVHEHLTRLIAMLSAPVLALLGDATASGHYLNFNGFGASVEGACDGVQPTYIYICAVLAFPSRWRDKGWGLLIGIPAIFLVNFVRVVTVMVCGAFWPEFFERVHLYGWQALVIVLTMAIWVFWAERFVRRGHQAHS